MTGPYLPPRLKEALTYCARQNRRGLLVWGAPKSMAALAEMGLVEQWTPPSVAERPRMKARPWRITEAGKAALA